MERGLGFLKGQQQLNITTDYEERKKEKGRKLPTTSITTVKA